MPRMRDISPAEICDKHLRGEHHEMHIFAGRIDKGMGIEGYCANGICDPSQILTRHNLLAAEMVKRGMQHHSPVLVPANLPHRSLRDKAEEKKYLANRCVGCKAKQED